MSNRSETFGRLLKGAINSIAAYEGKTAPAVEEDLGQQIGLAGSALQRYKAGNLPPDARTVEVLAAAAVRRAFLGRAWLQVFLAATRYPQPEALIARLAGEAPAPAPASAPLPSGTVTFLFTDIVGSTRLWEEQAGAMQRALARHDAILRQAIAEHGGHVFKTVGDAFCAAFATAPAAVAAALAAQRLILFEPWSACGLAEPLQVRTVLHTGAAEERDGDYFGPPLNRAARLCAVGHGGQVLLSLAAQELARDQLPPAVALRDLGEQRMKDLARPERIFQLVAPDLPADFPALRTLNAYRHNLPAQPTALIGREREVEDITDLLRAPDLRLLTLSGPGGTGKTRLALQAAGELVERFADGAWFVGLAPVSDPDLVAGTIAAVFGLREQGDRPIAAVLCDYLREKELLLLLDNFEQVAPAASLVAELLAAAPRLTVLATSRVVLRLYGEREYAVPPLSLPDRTPPPTFERVTQYEAVRLFIERARAVRADFAVTAANAPQIAEICHRLDGLPLAIELAAARSKLFAPQAILSRLDRRLATLTGGAQNLPARQQTLRGAIDWSYDLLDAAERECFARMGVFVGGCTLAAAAAVLAAGGDLLIEPLDMLASLVDKSLLTQSEGIDGEPRFSMLETIREYALERLAQSGEGEAIRRAHAMYYQTLGAAEFDQAYKADSEAEWHATAHRLQREYDNLRSALVWSQTTSGDAEVSIHLALVLSPVWFLRGAVQESIAGLERSLNQSPGVGSSRVHLHARIDLAELLAVTGHYASAQAHYDHALSLARDLGDIKRYASVLDRLGWLAREQGDSATAWSLMSESLAISRELGNPRGIASTLVSMAGIAILDEDPARAEALLAESRALLDGDDPDDMFGWRLNHLGNAAQLRGDYAQATQLYLESLTYYPDEFHFVRLAAYRNLGFAAVGQGDLAEAARRLAQALTLGRTVGDRTAQTWSMAGLGSAAALGGAPERAARLWGAAERLRQSIGCRPAPASRATYERANSIARAALGDEAFDAAWAAGQALSIEQAVAEALAGAVR